MASTPSSRRWRSWGGQQTTSWRWRGSCTSTPSCSTRLAVILLDFSRALPSLPHLWYCHVLTTSRRNQYVPPQPLPGRLRGPSHLGVSQRTAAALVCPPRLELKRESPVSDSSFALCTDSAYPGPARAPGHPPGSHQPLRGRCCNCPRASRGGYPGCEADLRRRNSCHRPSPQIGKVLGCRGGEVRIR